MKKIITIITSLMLGTALLTGCSDNSMDFQEKSYIAEGREINGIKIDVKDRKIDISLSKDDKIYIDYYENDKEYYDISLSDNNTLTMKTKTNKEWSDYIGSKANSDNRIISLKVPNNLLASMELSTSNENISIEALALTDSISVYVNNGNIEFEGLNIGNEINLETKKGNIKGTIIGSYEAFSISSKSKKGESNLPDYKEGGAKSLKSSANDGDINIEFVAK